MMCGSWPFAQVCLEDQTQVTRLGSKFFSPAEPLSLPMDDINILYILIYISMFI